MQLQELRPVNSAPSRKEGPRWTEKAKMAFEDLKAAVSDKMTLKFVDLKKEICIASDASTSGVGSALFQPRYLGEMMTPDNVVAFRAHALKTHEYGYGGSPYKLELLGLLRALEDYNEYVYGRVEPIKVYTDHKPLTFLFSQADQIRQYNLDIIHIAGESNEFPDALSRAFPDIWGVPVPKDPEQMEEMDTIMHETVQGMAEEMMMLLEPMTEVHEKIIDEYHGQGHFGIRQVMTQLRKQGHNWRGMEADVRAKLGNCQECMRWNVAKKQFFQRRNVFAALPWDHVQFDLITSLDPTPEAAYVLLIVDIFTGFAVLRKLKTKETDEVLEELWDVFTKFGIPKLVQSDNEPAFTGRKGDAFVEALQAKSITITPYNHRGLGTAESNVKIVSNALRKQMEALGGDWTKHLGSVTLQMNSRIMISKGFSPFELMFNRQPNLFKSVHEASSWEPRCANDLEDTKEWREHQERIMNELFPAVLDHDKALKFRNAEAFRRKNAPRMFPADAIRIGTPVMVWDQEMHNKNLSPYVGPYLLHEGSQEGRFKLFDPATQNYFHREATLDQLKICKLASIPEKDLESYHVDFVMDHRMEQGRHVYKVRFVGFNEESDQWLTAERIDPIPIRDYQNRLSRLTRTSGVEQEKVVASNLKKRTAEERGQCADNIEVSTTKKGDGKAQLPKESVTRSDKGKEDVYKKTYPHRPENVYRRR